MEENIDNEMVKDVGISAILEKPFHLKEIKPLIKEILAE